MTAQLPSSRVAPIRESQLEKYFRDRVRLAGGMIIKLAPTERGIPDRLVLLPGGTLDLVELKTMTGRVSPIQVLWHQRARQLGVKVHVLSGKAQILEWIRVALENAYEEDEA